VPELYVLYILNSSLHVYAHILNTNLIVRIELTLKCGDKVHSLYPQVHRGQLFEKNATFLTYFQNGLSQRLFGGLLWGLDFRELMHSDDHLP